MYKSKPSCHILGLGGRFCPHESIKWGHPAASKVTPFCLHCWEWPLGTGKGKMATQITWQDGWVLRTLQTGLLICVINFPWLGFSGAMI